jgi:Pilus formation protein N terminal region
MSSRLWLAVAFVLASGASPARAGSGVIEVTLDQAKLIKLSAEARTIIVGNPMIADVTKLKNNNAMVITGKGFGQTNLIEIDAEGSIIEDRQIQVLPAKTVLVLQKGDSRVSYACNPECMQTVQLGDDNDVFNKAGTQITMRDGLAQGGVSASMSGSGK